MCQKIGASILFVGDDWYGTDKWETIEQALKKLDIQVVYFPYTQGVSSTKIADALKSIRGWSLNEISGGSF